MNREIEKMVQTLQKRITSAYSFWFFAVYFIMFMYFLLTGNIFETYAQAAPWVFVYILFAFIGNIAVLIFMYKLLVPDKKSLKFIVLYEICFFAILGLTYLVISMEWLPLNGYGNLNFLTMLNAVLPVMFILLILAEYVFSKAVRMMPVRTN